MPAKKRPVPVPTTETETPPIRKKLRHESDCDPPLLPGHYEVVPSNQARRRTISTMIVPAPTKFCRVELSANATIDIIVGAIETTQKEMEEVIAAAVANPRLRFMCHGKPCTMRRHQSLYGISSYRYSRVKVRSNGKAAPALVKRCMVAEAERRGIAFDATWALVNVYTEAGDKISAHGDNESEVGVQDPTIGPVVATYSFYLSQGVERRFVVSERKWDDDRKKYSGYTRRWEFRLPHGSCAVMSGKDSQQAFHHEVKPMGKREAAAARDRGLSLVRISVTVRLKTEAMRRQDELRGAQAAQGPASPQPSSSQHIVAAAEHEHLRTGEATAEDTD